MGPLSSVLKHFKEVGVQAYDQGMLTKRTCNIQRFSEYGAKSFLDFS